MPDDSVIPTSVQPTFCRGLIPTELQGRELLDEVELRLVEKAGGKRRPKGKDLEETPTDHIFTSGLYARRIYLRKGLILTTKIHKTEHPYVVTKGVANVYNELTNEWERIEAPHQGITKPGTRRLLVILEDMVWTTYHPTQETCLETLEDELVEDYHNPRLHALLQAQVGGEAVMGVKGVLK